jgi:Rrf2 family protein
MSNTNTQFSIAVHILVGIEKYGKVNSNDLAESVNANPIFIKRIIAKLSSFGLVSTTSGRNGGSILARQAENITLLNVYKAVEAPKVFMVHSYPKNMSCKISTHIQNTMGEVLDDVQTVFEKQLSSISIKNVLEKVINQK